MPLQDGARITLWTFDDRETYALADVTTQTKSNGGYQTDFANRCLIVDQAYTNLKGCDLPKEKDESKRHVTAKIPDGKYKRTMDDGKTYDQAPISIQKRWNSERKKEDWTIKIWCAEVVESKKSDKQTENKPVDDTDANPFEQNVTKEEPMSQPAQSGFVGLDFLNIPDGFGENLPFK